MEDGKRIKNKDVAGKIRPKRTWNNKVVEGLKNRGTTWNEAIKMRKQEFFMNM